VLNNEHGSIEVRTDTGVAPVVPNVPKGPKAPETPETSEN